MALALTVELLMIDPHSHRAFQAHAAISRGAAPAGVTIVKSTAYRGDAPLLAIWGPGHPSRFEPMRRQMASGGHVLAMDLGYWDRGQKFRVSIDGPHPQAWVMRRAMPSDRFVADRVRQDDLWDPSGPVIIAGLGEKARTQYGADIIDAWESEQADAVRAAGRQVVYRAKKSSTTPIEDALRGASALITWHSNTAVDAIRLGVPVVCRDGAAAAICASTYDPHLRPLQVGLRDQFLANLAWFQWAPHETTAMWHWLREVLA
jgi:hypothetical protein